jgi:Uma2 family endonuclease
MTMQGTKSERWRRAMSGRKGCAGRGEPVGVVLQPHPGRLLTEGEFLDWIGERTRAEWVEGEVSIMSPVSFDHDQIHQWLIRLLGAFVEAHELGLICGSELFVRLQRPQARRMPDLFFVSKSRVTSFREAHFEGPPELAMEIVSPDEPARDYIEKLGNYESSGVREYWIVDPLIQRVEAHELAKGKYRRILERNGALHSKVLKGLWIKPVWLWQRPKVALVLREMGVK